MFFSLSKITSLILIFFIITFGGACVRPGSNLHSPKAMNARSGKPSPYISQINNLIGIVTRGTQLKLDRREWISYEAYKALEEQEKIQGQLDWLSKQGFKSNKVKIKSSKTLDSSKPPFMIPNFSLIKDENGKRVLRSGGASSSNDWLRIRRRIKGLLVNVTVRRGGAAKIEIDTGEFNGPTLLLEEDGEGLFRLSFSHAKENVFLVLNQWSNGQCTLMLQRGLETFSDTLPNYKDIVIKHSDYIKAEIHLVLSPFGISLPLK